MTCRDRNRIALQSDLLGASVLGIKNVLCMTGDHVTAGDHKSAKPVYDIESVQLLKAVDGLNNGRDKSGNEMKGPTDFLQGAVVTPEANPIEPQLIKFGKKVKAGAKFFQTQAIYDIDKFRDFMRHAEIPVRFLQVLLCKSAGMQIFLITSRHKSQPIDEPGCRQGKGARNRHGHHSKAYQAARRKRSV